jgi:hypothetical protein
MITMKIISYGMIAQMEISAFEMASGGPCVFAGEKVEFSM